MYKSNKEIRKKITKLTIRKQELERGVYMGKMRLSIQLAIKYFTTDYYRMNEASKARLHTKWDEYYAQCAKSKQAKTFKMLDKSKKAGHLIGHEMILHSIKRQMENGIDNPIPKPSKYDPELWSSRDWAIQYKMVCKELIQLKNYMHEDSMSFSNQTTEVI